MTVTSRRSVLLRAACAIALFGSLSARGQDAALRIGAGTKPLTIDDLLKNAAKLQPQDLPGLQWHPAGDRFSWVKAVAGKPALVEQDLAGDERVVLTQDELQAAFKEAKLAGAVPGISPSLRWSSDGSLRLVHDNAVHRIDLAPVRISRGLAFPKGGGAVALSPGDRQAACVRDFNVWVVKADGTTFQVTREGYDDLTHGVAVSRNEFGIHDGLWWDREGRRLAFYREDLRGVEPYPYVDFTVRPPRPERGRYPMAGRRGSVVSIGVYDSRDDRVVWLDSDPRRDEYLTNVTWGPRGERLYVAHVNRAQDTMDLVEYDAATGKRVGVLFTESDEQWVEPEHGPIFLKDGRFLWLSPRGGYRQLYLHAPDGTLLRRVNQGDSDVTAFRGFDAREEGFYFETPGRDPRHKHLWHATLDGAEHPITAGRGQHDVLIAPGGAHFLDVHSNLVLPLAIDLLGGGGERVRRVYAAPNPLADYRLGTQRFFEAATADGSRLYGHLCLPPDLEEGRTYPVIHYVYGGPHSQLVQDRWLGGGGRWGLWLHCMAARGYVVLRADNRGTSNRGIEFEQAVHRRLGTCEIADQTLALEHVLGLGFADPARVGVHGWSYGGFLTLSLMTRKGTLYRAGIAGAPVTDWAYYETGYGERYMDTPEENPVGYRLANPGNHLRGLQGRLLVVHGLSDRTVVGENTVDFLRRCVDAGTPVETMFYPEQVHGLRGKAFDHFLRKMTDFFDRELAPGR